ncbi:hypothetical protein [Aeromonas phage Asp37]|nr:hypothetical protein [Aeromonas phage Asp37]
MRTQDLVTIATTIILTLSIFAIGKSHADDKIDIFGQHQEQRREAKTEEWERDTGISSPKQFVDEVEGVIQRAEAAEQQGRRIIRLFSK